MIFRHIAKSFFYLAVCLYMPNSVAAQCYLDDGKHDCGLYKIADKRLNQEYRSLFQSLGTADRDALKNKQIEWIKWKDDYCLKSVEESGCTNTLCEATNYNYCMADVTNRRTEELKKFKLEVGHGKKPDFSFSKETLD